MKVTAARSSQGSCCGAWPAGRWSSSAKESRQGFTFVSDTAAGILAAGLSDRAVGQTINLGSGKEITISRLAAMIAEVMGRDDAEINYAEHRPGDVVRLLSDSSKAQEFFGFKQRVSLRDGLACLRNWYASQNKSVDDLLQEEVLFNWERNTRK